jgi:hypothetical protein
MTIKSFIAQTPLFNFADRDEDTSGTGIRARASQPDPGQAM